MIWVMRLSCLSAHLFDYENTNSHAHPASNHRFFERSQRDRRSAEQSWFAKHAEEADLMLDEVRSIAYAQPWLILI